MSNHQKLSIHHQQLWFKHRCDLRMKNMVLTFNHQNLGINQQDLWFNHEKIEFKHTNCCINKGKWKKFMVTGKRSGPLWSSSTIKFAPVLQKNVDVRLSQQLQLGNAFEQIEATHMGSCVIRLDLGKNWTIERRIWNDGTIAMQRL